MCSSVACSLRLKTSRKGVAAAYTSEEKISQDIPPEFETNIESGFQIATFQGPLCAEPMEGLAYFVEDIEFDAELLDDESSGHMFRINKPRHYPTIGILFTGASKMAQVGGSMITASKETCRLGFLDWSPRLKMAMYSCDIQASSPCSYQQAMGRYAVL